ncbi:MAG TPA: NADH-quinone oxidoreductase subunit L [Candidatus Limnocylindria bacterium]|nr:NADH-quinone oxidoreductase subunit L [Candidatus Limnocylindria bacterium]
MTETHASYVALIPLLPLAGATVLGLGGATIQKRFGERAIGAIACATVAASFVLSVVAFAALLGRAPDERLLLAELFTWIDLDPLKVELAFAVDPLSAVMILIVTGIGGLIHLYATGYMHGDQGFWRFFAYLNLFTFAMLTLVLGDSLLLMFVGWEGVGFCSWGLIGFWHKEMANARAGNKAFIVNRVGDFGFLLGMFLLFWALAEVGDGTLTFREIQRQAHLLDGLTFWGWPVATLVTLLLFVGATGKSAQIPLYVWLPDAMAGPTPVSALIHAATMVTAGVYMIGRMNFLFAMAPATLAVVATTGVLTALLAATIATSQTDIKKVLAYSTVSQLGLMFLGMGVGAYAAGIFHLMTHAFFKACLFLGSGSVIHAMGGEQDMRKMGGLRAHLPATSTTFIVSTLAIAGIPPLAGFFSKDEILWQAFSSEHGSPLLYFGGLVVAGFTAFYMFRQVFMVFFGECRADEHTRHHLHESPASMTVPLWILMAGAVVMGFLWIPNVFTPFEHFLEPVLGGHHAAAAAGGHQAHHAVGVELALMAVSVAVAVAGIALAYLMYYRGTIRPEAVSGFAGGWLYRTVLNKYWVDELYELVFVRGLAIGVARMLAWFDAHVIDGIVNAAGAAGRGIGWLIGLFDAGVIDGAVNGVADGAYVAGRSLRRLQSGAITAYLYVIAFGVLGGVFLYWSLAVAS